ILFQSDNIKRFSATPLLDERLFVIAAASFEPMPKTRTTKLAHIPMYACAWLKVCRAICPAC
ncbi:hypothetical protein ACRXB1_21605, partial [Caballeronia sp. M23-90]